MSLMRSALLAGAESVWLREKAMRRPFVRRSASRAQVAHENPFTDDVDVGEARLREIWAAETAKRRNVLAARGWAHLEGWKAACR